MEQQPDKLFREKLEGFSRPIPASAWSRVEAGLNKKKDNRLWLKVAASLLVLAVAAVLLWSERTTESDRVAIKDIAREKAQTSKDKTQINPNNQITIPIAIGTKAGEKVRVPETVEAPAKELPRNKSKISPQGVLRTNLKSKISSPPAEVIEEEVSVPEAIVEEIPAEKIEVTETQTIVALEEAPATKEAEGITLVYTAEEVNAKYLDKKSLAEATSGERKPSTLKKLISKAYDLKNNQDPFGELRQKKNEILALNFRSEKQRNQNK